MNRSYPGKKKKRRKAIQAKKIECTKASMWDWAEGPCWSSESKRERLTGETAEMGSESTEQEKHS